MLVEASWRHLLSFLYSILASAKALDMKVSLLYTDLVLEPCLKVPNLTSSLHFYFGTPCRTLGRREVPVMVSTEDTVNRYYGSNDHNEEPFHSNK